MPAKGNVPEQLTGEGHKPVREAGKRLDRRTQNPRSGKRPRRPSLTLDPERYNDEIPDPDMVIPE
ncbi:MAG TPA: hypothetical protein GXX30_04370 [Firmicutes bacterium]|uniref:Uncharacterized protein n=1 Tax=Candidatus Fermentithermobacillus carboniphilus TaxID=3085328 RepID=A0AAT9LEV6_9FIRM|nr:MAG: hypothetical protein IMF26_00840 [Candidatus Fermentithermobacillus carboniphilus]HHW18119.1 hypothetical protein [Candidatus Fermentithermobacillaceae bacterium]